MLLAALCRGRHPSVARSLRASEVTQMVHDGATQAARLPSLVVIPAFFLLRSACPDREQGLSASQPNRCYRLHSGKGEAGEVLHRKRRVS